MPIPGSERAKPDKAIVFIVLLFSIRVSLFIVKTIKPITKITIKK